MKKTYLYFGNSLPKMVSRRFPGASLFGSAAYKTDAETAKEAAEKKQKEDAKAISDKEIELKAIKIEKPEDFTKAFQLQKEIAELKGKNLDEKLAAIEEAQRILKEAKPEVTAEELQVIKEDLEVTIKAFDKLQVRMKYASSPAAPAHVKTFNEILGETIDRHESDIKNYRNGEIKMDMMPEYKEKDKEGNRNVKAVGDMSMSANFPAASEFITDRRTNLIETPYNRVWLADILPQGQTNSPSILYPKENGGEGGAALWTDPAADKAQMDFDFTTQQAFIKWIAGYVIVPREMLDDIPWLRSYLMNRMLISIKTAENSFVLHGNAAAPAVDGLLDVATAYSGTYVKLFEKILDAAFGQIPEDTFSFYQGNIAVIRPRDAVNIGLNTAGGSGEYDLPPGSVGWVNGQLTLGGLRIVQTTQIGAAGSFLVFDSSATTFIRRMQPELRMFEDATLAKKNKIMFRVEERATLATFNDKAIVSNVGES